MAQQAFPVPDVRADSRPTVTCCHHRRQARVPLGLGSGDRFEALGGGSGSFKGMVLRADKPLRLQGKRANKRFSQIS
jgi:hypothetical protein